MNRRLAACVLVSLALGACHSRASEDGVTARAASEPRAVTVAAVRQRMMGANLSLSGLLVSREEAAVSSQVTGYPVASVFVDQDDEVRRGQPLARLDDTLLRADIAQQRAVVMQQRIAAEKAGEEAARVAGLANSGVLSAEAIAERKLAARTAEAGVAQAKAQLDSLLVKQRLMTIRAPVAGRILSRSVRPGDIASPTTVMFLIGRDDLVEVDAEVPEQSMDKIRVGQRALVTLQSGATTQGVVRLVSASIDAQTKLGRARILLPVNRNLRPGGFATVSLGTTQGEMNAVPEAALQYSASGATVVVLDDRNRARTTSVKTGAHAGGYVALLKGPPVGARVLTGGQGFVLDGDVVKPVQAR